MTHDELLAEIDKMYEFVAQVSAHTWVYPALRAVVKLHTPDWRNQCSHCLEPNDHDELNKNYLYPCPTIQAIEKELK